MTSSVALSEIVKINLGQTFRGKAELDDSSSGIRLVQIKDIQEGEIRNLDNLGFANIEHERLKVRLNTNDILLPLRGNRIEAAIITADLSNEVVTTTNQVAVMRNCNNDVDLDFILWFFNSEMGSDALNAIRKGSTISSINKDDLASVKLSIPSSIIQARISKIYRNWLKQNEVLNQMLINGARLSERACIMLYESKVEE